MEDISPRIDEPNVCTKLAEEYLRTKIFYKAEGLEGIDDNCTKDQLKNGIEVYYTSEHLYESLNQYSKVPNLYSSVKLFTLIQKIEENAELFCQLEYLNRKIPINDTKNVDLKLISQSLVYRSSFKDYPLYSPYTRVFLHADTPLYQLGYLAYCPPNHPFSIICTKATVPVCTLFYELCMEAGVPVKIIILQDDKIAEKQSEYYQRVGVTQQDGCVGVVSARSDMDSAVDAFLAASTWYPWRLRWLLVQESGLERFTCALNTRSHAGRRTFALEPAGELPPGAVPVEAYRTTREALALLETCAPLAVAAFAADAAEAHEIAFGAPVPLVWINGHGTFGGPPLTAAAVFLQAPKLSIMPELKERSQWLKLTPVTRLALLRDALHKFSHHSDPSRPIRPALSCDSAVAVDGSLWIATRTPVDFLMIDPRDYESVDDDDDVMSFSHVLNYMLMGGHVLVSNQRTHQCPLIVLITALSKTVAPIAWDRVPQTATYSMYSVKTINSTVGTIFAN